MHTHTSLSDGKGTSDQLLSYARDVAHLDFVVFSDHDFGNGPPWRMPPQAWNQIQDKVDEYTVAGKFVAIAGYEWTYQLNWEQSVRMFLGTGGRTGFVGGSDTHEGKPAARTAVLAEALTREGLFEALRSRRNYAVTHARIVLDFRINGVSP